MKQKKQIAVVAGGYSGESVISLKSADMIMTHIDRSAYEPTLVIIDNHGWRAEVNGKVYPIDKNHFSVETGKNSIKFDGAFNIIHGAPGENGVLQGYFTMIGMPHTTGGVFNMSLTFNKSATNKLLNNLGFMTSPNILLRSHDHYSTSDIVSRLGLPLFVKPNAGGSSLGTSRVNAKEALHSAIDFALKEDDEVIIEQFIEGREYTCGVIMINGVVTALPITEIVSHTEFFDYEAKYEGKSDEITPALLPEALKNSIHRMSESVYTLLNCRGMMRVDYIVNDSEPNIIEVNTVPGFSAESIIPQQSEAAGISKTELISHVLSSCDI
jgi:D-alanine-D-alanine ligase